MNKRHSTPKRVDPSTLEPGDYVRVTYPTREGVTASVTGRVGRTLIQGERRQVLTPVGGRLFAWFVIGGNNFRVELLEAAPSRQATLFDDVPA